MAGRRIEGLKDLTPEQDLELVKRYFEIHPFVQALEPEDRAHWYETHMEHAKRYGTNISEQLVITQLMTDAMVEADCVIELLGYLQQSA